MTEKIKYDESGNPNIHISYEEMVEAQKIRERREANLVSMNVHQRVEFLKQRMSHEDALACLKSKNLL